MDDHIVLAGGMRTPFGDFGKSLREVPLAELGVHAAKASLARTGLSASKVDHLVFDNVLPVDYDGHFTSRKVALGAGLPVAETQLRIPRERTNLYGGGISIGLSPGATGIRMTITAMHHLAASGGRYAIVSMCCGAGQGMATLIENLRY